jgi:hypothetical protein
LEIATVKGEIDEVAKQLKVLPQGYYLSEKKGPVKIKTMNSYHLANALKKQAYSYYNDLKLDDDNARSIRKFLLEFTGISESKTLQGLFDELVERADM